MKTKRYDKYDALMCCYPDYELGVGNVSMMIFENRRGWGEISEKTCLSRWAKHYRIDLMALKDETEFYLHRKKYLPLVLSEDCTLIPIKVRHPLCRDDGAYGYVREECIAYVDEKDHNAVIHLTNNEEVQLLMKIKRFENYERDGVTMRSILYHTK
jgi:hypothetical protein